MTTTIDLWTALAERNEFIPPSQVELPRTVESHEPLLRRLVERVVPDLPGPLPKDLFDPASARVADELVACALARLHPANPFGRQLATVAAALPTPQTAAAHVTQAAILWYAIPVARRMQSEAFKAMNQMESTAEAKEAAGELLLAVLARRPLLSLRADAEEFFSRSEPPFLDGVLDCLGLRRWLIQRLASPCDLASVLARRSKVLRQLHEGDLRELLVLLGASTPPPSPVLIADFLPLLDRGQWPDDLAPALRRIAATLRKHPEEDDHDGPQPDA